MWEIILAIIVAIVFFMFIRDKKCTVTCGSKANLMRRENMSAGLGTVNSMALYNHANNCHEGNAMGSNSPFCTTTGYVII